jgi:hypothetical protein
MGEAVCKNVKVKRNKIVFKGYKAYSMVRCSGMNLAAEKRDFVTARSPTLCGELPAFLRQTPGMLLEDL